MIHVYLACVWAFLCGVNLTNQALDFPWRMALAALNLFCVACYLIQARQRLSTTQPVDE